MTQHDWRQHRDMDRRPKGSAVTTVITVMILLMLAFLVINYVSGARPTVRTASAAMTSITASTPHSLAVFEEGSVEGSGTGNTDSISSRAH